MQIWTFGKSSPHLTDCGESLHGNVPKVHVWQHFRREDLEKTSRNEAPSESKIEVAHQIGKKLYAETGEYARQHTK
jgi:hypothetical protein